MSEKEEFEYTDKLVAEEAADYLTKIADGLRARLLKLQGMGQMITVVPQDAVKLEVKAERKENKGKLQLEISWKEKYAASEEKLEVSVGASPEPEAFSVRKGKNKGQTEDLA